MKMKTKFISITLCLFVMVSYAQQTASMKGTITHRLNGQPVKIMLTLYQDTTKVQSIMSSDNGQYLFEGLSSGCYMLQIGNTRDKNIIIPEIILCAGEEKVIDLIGLNDAPESIVNKLMPTPPPTKEVDGTISIAYDVVTETTESSTPLIRAASKNAKIGEATVTESSSILQNDSKIQSHKLTSGEVNDFAKWNQWDTILNKHFESYLQTWNFKPLQRYMVQIVNQQNAPVVNVTVILKDKCGQVHWKAQTDNTGKAELWLHSFSPDISPADCFIEWQYRGETGETVSAIEFSQGINHIKIPVSCKKLNHADLFFVLDATGSMSDEMRYLQVELQDIVERIHKAQKKINLRIGSLVYRDEGDEYITRKQSLDADLQKTIHFLNEQQAGGGGDYPEAVDEALYQTIANESWDNDAVARIVFIILDAPGHTEKALKIAQQMHLAAEKGIRIVPIACSDIRKDGEYLMRCLALATNGTYLFLTDDSGIGNPHIKPTTDKYEVEKLNDAIARIVKQYTKMPDCRGQEWDQEDTVFTKADEFVPNPYDENPDISDSVRIAVYDLIKVYPNPCQTIVHVELKQPVQDLWLVDMSGKSLKTYNTNNGNIIEINMQNLAVGIYFIKAFYKGKWYSEKIVKVH